MKDKVKEKNIDDILRVEGVKAKGYGIIPKLVMRDERLTIEAKAIYSYFCSYAGSGNTAFPKVYRIRNDLCIGEDRYYKHFSYLKKFGYIKVEHNKDANGKFINNIYTLIDKPLAEENEPKPDFTGMDKPCMENPSPENKGSNNNNSNINNNKNKQSVSLEMTDGQFTSSITESSVQETEDKIKQQIGYNELGRKYDISIIDEVTNNILDMYYSDSMVIDRVKKPGGIVKHIIMKLNYWNIEYVLERFMNYTETIKNKKSFMQTLIYKSVTETNTHYRNFANVT